ncbi:glycerate kinase [Frondihabitans australicus]|uniref:Glycerate kinase n=1 Tax=Frondihabitans australicus TaxID=386892 RepID=A0A495IIW1_9MICO|nr:glycerate kinase [Frondihabitans australicus]RKR75640.1 glycerate kinase [Frondihabitans australicus]
MQHRSSRRAARVVIAPDSFKGSADAREAAAAIGRGWLSGRPGDEILLRPMADGGEGTLDAFETAVPGAIRQPITVSGPLGSAVEASWLLLPDGTAVVELASTSGITLLGPDQLNAQEASTRGFGEAIAAAVAGGATRLLLAVGSSCSTDGGAGALQALGATIVGADGTEIGPGARGLAKVRGVDLSSLPPPPERGAVVISDVANPLLGPRGAAAVFGPQKGATPEDIRSMDTALARFAFALSASGIPVDPSTPGAGAAGGTAFGLLAWGATLTPGSEIVAETIALADDIDASTVVVTGEGRFDEQSAEGKVPAFVLWLAERRGASTLLVAGSIDAATTGFDAAESLSAIAGSAEAAIADPAPALEEAGRRLAAHVSSREAAL